VTQTVGPESAAGVVPARGMRWFHWIILAGILGIGAELRFHHIDRQSQFPDEFWSVYLSTGRGFDLFRLPQGKLLDPPPKAMMDGAPSWPHIWTGMGTAVHPPLYHIFLRWWMDLFGESDRSTRGFSALCSLAGILLIFSIVRRTTGTAAALAAAAVMALAVTQIDLSQQTRSYTLWALIGLVACHAMVRIEQDGATRGALIQLGVAIFAGVLTHYLSIGPFTGLGCYAIYRLRGTARRKTIAAMAVGTVIALIMWGPWLWQQRTLLTMDYGWMLEDHPDKANPFTHSLAMPAIHLYGDGTIGRAEIYGIAAIVYVLPLLLIRRRPELLIWWFVILGMILSLAIRDWMKGTMLTQYPRYSFFATPAICAIVAAPLALKGWRGWLLPGVIIVSVAISAGQRVQAGQFYRGDWRYFSQAVDQRAGKNDPLVFCADPFWGSATFPYLALAHYAPDSHRPIMMLKDPADAGALEQLSAYPQVWLIGPSGTNDAPRWLAGWKVASSFGIARVGFLEKMIPENAVISPEPSHSTARTPPP
jgi:hypothetical protein